MATFARGKNAHGFCDVCGFRCQLSELKEQFVAGRSTRVRACRTCYDPDHPQNFLYLVRKDDPQALRNPRPDPALLVSRNIPGQPGSAITTETGVTITTETGDGIAVQGDNTTPPE